ncbi:MAG: hypothetical protein ABH864_00780 [archaeon]
MKGTRTKLIAFAAVVLVLALSVFLFFSIYFSWGFLTSTGRVIDDFPQVEGPKEEVQPKGDLDFVSLEDFPGNELDEQNISYGLGGGSSRRGSGGGGGGETQNLWVSLLSSYSRSLIQNGSANFLFGFEGNKQLSYCEVYLDDLLKGSFLASEFEEVGVSNVSAGRHDWRVVCFDDSDVKWVDEAGSAVFFKALEYGGRTTNLDSVDDLSRVINFTLEDSYNGMIVFGSSVNLSGGFDFDQFVRIQHNLIAVDSSSLPELNVPATLTFYDLDFENPVILRDGVVCEDCQLVEGGEGFTFKVGHFSSYTVSENSALHLFDTTDSEGKYVSESVTFYANYTNVTDSSPITGSAFCNVTFPDSSEVEMPYNAGSGMYEYSRSFSDPGTYLFEVKCYGADDGFTSLSGNDTYTILQQGVGGGVNGANVTKVWSESASSDEASNSSAFAGNITEIVVTAYSTTQSWQGYVGNVSGAVELADASGDVLYNWSAAQPDGEVYASTSSSISWRNIQCFNFTANGLYGNESVEGALQT